MRILIPEVLWYQWTKIVKSEGNGTLRHLSYMEPKISGIRTVPRQQSGYLSILSYSRSFAANAGYCIL